MDGPGHYFRRIKTMAVSIPCVTGPYAIVRDDTAEDDCFNDYLCGLQSIVTSDKAHGYQPAGDLAY